jgi:hypothetical protein
MWLEFDISIEKEFCFRIANPSYFVSSQRFSGSDK